MLLSLGAALVLHVAMQGVEPPRQAALVRDTLSADSLRRLASRRLPVTPEVLATAFRDADARALFYRARRARTTQDSSIQNYEAKVRVRLSAWVGIGGQGRERVMFREESASRVQWQRGVGARVELTGARVGIPVAGAKEERNELRDNVTTITMTPIPYFPGHESLLGSQRVAQSEVHEDSLMNPLADGAEAYYTYETGDSLRYTLPDGTTIQVRELKVRPRWPNWNLAVGSLMFDTRSGQVVWAAYRLSAPRELPFATPSPSDTGKHDRALAIANGVAKAVFGPVTVQISEILIEYSLHEGRYWLPRKRSLRGVQQVSLARMPITIEHSYQFESINRGNVAIPPIVLNEPPTGLIVAPDSLKGDAAAKWRATESRRRDSLWKAFRDSLDKTPCDSTGMRTRGRFRQISQLTVAVTVPCDLDKLVSSPDLPKSLYAEDEETFGVRDRDELMGRAIALAAQAPFSLGRRPAPRLAYGTTMTRYNRIEGFSTGLGVDQQIGAGYVVSASGRLGFADMKPLGELSLSRTNVRKTISVTGYSRLVSAGDWGDPLTFRASVPALLFGRDDGFYYRAMGASVGVERDGKVRIDGRLFAERQRSAVPEASFSIGGNFIPNIEAAPVVSAGASLRLTHQYGLDPRGFRTYTDVRLEGAGGDSTYGRGAIDVTMSGGFAGRVAAALTVAGGSTIGELPSQRRWFLGGTHTIRGQSPDTVQSGNAFWLARGEIGPDMGRFRLTVFGDVGWVGNRSKLADVGRPLSGVGIGYSVFDGLLRVDFAQGIYPRNQFRVDLSLGAHW